MADKEGWTPPDNFRLQREFFNRYGDEHYTREIDKRWRTMGKLIDHGAKVRIPDGRHAR